MINLIPPQAKKTVIKEYWIRVATVWMFLLSAAFIIMAVESLPSYILLDSLEKALSSQVDGAEAAKSSYIESENIISNANSLIRHLNDNGSEIYFSELLSELDLISGASVSLTQFTFSEDGKISLIGHASDRVSLSDFRDSLEDHPQFSSVELPISNLAKDKDITFTMTVSLVEKK